MTDPNPVLAVHMSWTGASSGTVAQNFKSAIPKFMRAVVEANRMGSQVERSVLGAFKLEFAAEVRAISDGVFAALLRDQCRLGTLVTVTWCLNTAGTAGVATPLLTIKGYVSKPPDFGAEWGQLSSTNIEFAQQELTVDDGASPYTLS